MYVDYERSSWRYMDYDQKAMPHEDLDCYKIGGANHTFCDTMDAYMIGKGGGSAYGGNGDQIPISRKTSAIWEIPEKSKER